MQTGAARHTKTGVLSVIYNRSAGPERREVSMIRKARAPCAVRHLGTRPHRIAPKKKYFAGLAAVRSSL